jgi:hypothetical protein
MRGTQQMAQASASMGLPTQLGAWVLKVTEQLHHLSNDRSCWWPGKGTLPMQKDFTVWPESGQVLPLQKLAGDL